MFFSKASLATVAAVGTFGAAVGLATAATAMAEPAGPPPSLPAPAWAPKKPAETWQGQPMVWWNLPAGGHWGVWINGDFLPFT